MRDHRFFFFVRLMTVTGDHLATETVHSDSDNPADIVGDAAMFFGADDNGAHDAEAIARAVIEVYGPFTQGNAALFRAVEDADAETGFRAEPYKAERVDG